MTKPLHIFRAGRHTAQSGACLEFSEAEVGAIAANYDPALHEAPIVVGQRGQGRCGCRWRRQRRHRIRAAGG